MKEITAFFLVLVTLTVLTVFPTIANALTEKQLEELINETKAKQEELDEETGKLERQLGELEKEITIIDREMILMDQSITETNEEIRELEEKINETSVYIDDLKDEISELEIRIAGRDELLRDRVRSMYQNGSVINFVEVILGAQSFGDLIERIIAFNTIAQQDRNILDQYMEDKTQLEKAEEQLSDQIESLETQKENLLVLLEQLEKQRQEKDRLLTLLVQEQGFLEDQVMTLDEEKAIIEAQEIAAQKELEDIKLAQVAPKNNSSSRNSPSDTGATLLRPATGTITTGFEMRWGRMHYGIDIGKNGRTEDVPVVAAESGTVIRSYYSSSYGNTVMIRHNVNGQVLTTLYAHLDNRAVNAGDTVSRGQFLGLMGNTGRSFGPHLHFEVHEGDWNVNKSNAVDPLQYIN